MKHWRANYAVRFKDGHTDDFSDAFEAETIDGALKMAMQKADDLVWVKSHRPQGKDPSTMIDRVVLWSIGIIEMDPF